MVTVLILYLMNVLEEKYAWILNICIIITCVIIFVLSWTLIYQVKHKAYNQNYYIEGKSKTKITEAQASEQTQEPNKEV